MIHQVVDGIYRGPCPKSSNDFDAVQRLRIKSILDLETYALDLRGNEREGVMWRCASYGIAHFSLPLGAILPPSMPRLGLAVQLLRTSTQALPRPLLVSCRQGVDRTGIVIAAYRVRAEEAELEAAIEEMLEMGFHVGRYWWWLPQLERFSRA